MRCLFQAFDTEDPMMKNSQARMLSMARGQGELLADGRITVLPAQAVHWLQSESDGTRDGDILESTGLFKRNPSSLPWVTQGFGPLCRGFFWGLATFSFGCEFQWGTPPKWVVAHK